MVNCLISLWHVGLLSQNTKNKKKQNLNNNLLFWYQHKFIYWKITHHQISRTSWWQNCLNLLPLYNETTKPCSKGLANWPLLALHCLELGPLLPAEMLMSFVAGPLLLAPLPPTTQSPSCKLHDQLNRATHTWKPRKKKYNKRRLK